MYRYFFLILGAISIGLSLSYSFFWPLIFVSVLPLVRLVYAEDLEYKHLFSHGWLFGFLLIGSTIHWFFNALPLTWLGISDSLVSVILIFFVWLVVSVVLGVAVGLWAVCARVSRTHLMVDMVTFSTLWVLFEYLRMWIFTVVTYGPGSLLESNFSFGFIGYALAQSSLLLPLASFGGVFVLSFTTFFVSMSLYVLYKRFGLSMSLSVALVIVVLGVFYPSSGAVSPLSLDVATVNTNFKSLLYVSSMEQQFRRSVITQKLRNIVVENPQVEVIVLPEGSRYTSQFTGEEYKDFFAQLFGEREVLIVDTNLLRGEEGLASHVVFFSSTKGLLASHMKRFLLPFGEYMPYAGEVMFRALGMRSELAEIKRSRTRVPSNKQYGFEYKGVDLVALSCSDTVSPVLYRKLSQGSNPKIFLNLSSQSWFHNSKNPFNQLIVMAKVHATWNNTPYIQATNAGLSFRVFPYGHIYFTD